MSLFWLRFGATIGWQGLPKAEVSARSDEGVSRDLLRLGFLSAHDPFDRRAFSGTTFHAGRALRALDGVAVTTPGWKKPGSLARLTARARRRLTAIPRGSELSGLDVLIALVSSDLVDALPDGHPPLLHVTDATPAFLRDFYGHDVSDDVDRREARVLARAAIGVYSSDYMARRAAHEFDLAPERVSALPFGVNLDAWPRSAVAKGPMAPARILFVGTEWKRKGGDIALAAFETLRTEGMDVHLDLVGAEPEVPLPEGVTVHGYLHKNRSSDARRLDALFGAAHLFMLPTRADCTPMVIAEAGVHATPVLVTETGGIRSLVENGVNGQLLPEGSDPKDWARAAAAILSETSAHTKLSHSAYEFASTRLTWDAWARGIAELARGVASGARSRV